jgi:hypothetical protein
MHENELFTGEAIEYICWVSMVSVFRLRVAHMCFATHGQTQCLLVQVAPPRTYISADYKSPQPSECCHPALVDLCLLCIDALSDPDYPADFNKCDV